MDAKCFTLKVVFFPFMAAGHLLPMVDIAKLFADHGAKVFVITTPVNAPPIQRSIARHPIQLLSIPFPSTSLTGLPEGCENASSVTSPDSMQKFIKALTMFEDPFARVLGEFLPDCVVTDVFFPWTQHVSAELGIPRLVFHGTSFFSLCVGDSIYRHREALAEEAEAELFIVPDLPDEIKMLRSQVWSLSSPNSAREELLTKIRESEVKSYGVVVNSFYELEPEYAQHYRKVVGRKAWHIGPVALCNDRGNVAGPTDDTGAIEYIQWLDSKSTGSVVYVCFGSMGRIFPAQLREIALGLEESGHAFVWVVKSDDHNDNEWFPEKFEERVEGRGLVIRGWAPQILILAHRAVGGFVTHCGWNSSLEGISAGLPMVTWPMFADQFSNERMIVELMKIGVEVGVKKFADMFREGEVVEATRIARVVDRVMGGGEEAEERRRRARELGEMARSAVKKGGSSYVDLEILILELMDRQSTLLHA